MPRNDPTDTGGAGAGVRIEPRPFDDPVGAVLRAELEAEVVVRHADCQDSICFERALR